MISLASVLNSLAIIVIAIVLSKELSDNNSHWNAVTHELYQVWDSINELEGVAPETVGEPSECDGKDVCDIQFKEK